ncbi:MAG: domain containing protein [Humibacillus sp.]|nr:domain containing protein [Humibacillus sp.]
MQLRLTIVEGASGAAASNGTDVVVDAPSGARFGELRRLLERTPTPGADGPQTFTVNGLALDDAAVLGERPLLRGAVVLRTSAPPARMPSDPVGLVDLRVVGGRGAGRTVRLTRGEHLVGRSEAAAVRLTDPGASRAHAIITVGDGVVTVRDLEPANPSLLDGTPLPVGGALLGPGSRLTVGSTLLALRPRATTPRPHATHDGRVLVHVRPRFAAPATPTEVELPEEPRAGEGQRLPLLAAVAPLALSGALALAMQSPVMLLFALMSPVLLLGQWWSDRRHGRRSHRSRMRQHREDVAAAEAHLRAVLDDETRRRHDEQPDLCFVQELLDHRASRLWERRPHDADWLALRIGTATQPARTVLRGAPHDGAPLVHRVPVVVELPTTPVLGVVGPRRDTLSLVGSLLTQVAAWHSPRRVRLALLSGSAVPQHDWDWLPLLPHALSSPADEMVRWATARDHDGLTALVAELSTLVVDRQGESPRPSPASSPSSTRVATDLVVVLDGAKELRSVPGVADLLKEGPTVGIAFLCLDDDRASLPAETLAVVALGSSATVTTSGLSTGDVTADLPDTSWLRRAGRALAPLRDATPDADAGTVPPTVGFRDLHRADGVDPLDPVALRTSWSRTQSTGSADPVAVEGAAALVGVTAAGALRLDLTRDGPHALIGGTTGSGKSELLRSLVAGLAAAHRPDDLSFVLIDYKGGAAFRDCSRLPHTLGLVTDLDEHLTQRALTSLAAELRRREALLARVGARDLDDYRHRTAAHPDPRVRLGRLVIVVDEFKMLADELPDFVAGLVKLAATGRSLGLHLVLATQRPAGIITGDMRTNIALRICLRVRDRADSDDVIDGPEAAALLESQPGRAYLRRDGRLMSFQTAHVGGASTPPAPAGVTVHVLGPTPVTGDVCGWPPVRAAEQVDALGSELASTAETVTATELSAFVEVARRVARELGIVTPPAPWLQPLPDAICVDALPPVPSSRDAAAPFGLTDRPADQRQETATWDPLTDGHVGVIGGARSGRTTLARTLVTGLAARWSPADLHVHILEGHRGALADLAQLPHVGSVVSTVEPSLLHRVVSRLREDLPADTDGGPRLVVLVVDGWEAVEDALDRTTTGSGADALLALVRDGAPRGLRVVVTGGRSVGSGRVASLLDRRLVLHLPDPLDQTLVGVEPAVARRPRPPGRAIDVADGSETQVATISDPAGTTDPVAAVGHLVNARTTDDPSVTNSTATTASTAARLPWRVVSLPTGVTLTETTDPPLTAGALHLGVGGDDAEWLSIAATDLPPRFLVVGPPRSGRTAALTLMARQLDARGRTVVVITGRRPASSRGWSGLPVLTATDTADFIALRQQTPDLTVVVDDADAFAGTDLEQALVECARLADDSGGLLWAAADTTCATAAFRGLLPALARDGNGIILCPTGPADGEVLRARTDPAAQMVPGRGALVLHSRCTPIQLAHV